MTFALPERVKNTIAPQPVAVSHPAMAATPAKCNAVVAVTSAKRKAAVQTTLSAWVPLPSSGPVATTVTRLDTLYWLRKPVPDERWKLMATPRKTAGFAGEESEPYPLHWEGREWVGVPRFWGVQHYGPPHTDDRSLGAPMNPALQFTWELQNTPQKPQRDAVQAWLDHHGEGILCLPCGAGKTVIAVYLALQMHRRTLILVENGGLLLQWTERIHAICPEAKVGIIQQDKCQIEDQDFVIGMIQTVRGTAADLASFGLVIVDECHHIAARTFSQSVMKTRPRYLLGLSATPQRKDGLTDVLHWLLGPLVFKSVRRDVTPQTIFQVEYPSGNHKVICYKGGTKGLPSMITRMTQDPQRNQLLQASLDRLVRMPGVTKILVLSDRRDHLAAWEAQARAQGYATGLYIGSMKKAAMEESKSQRIIFASYSMAKEYLDIDGLNGVLLATPCLVDTEQVVGRLRENLASEYGCATWEEDAAFEAEVRRIIPTPALQTRVLQFLKTPVSRTRVVVDVVDPFDVFDALAWKRFRVYQRLNYSVRRLKMDEWLARPVQSN